MRFFSNSFFTFLRLPYSVYGILKKIADQRNFLQKNIQPQLNKAADENDGSLDASDFNKITHYYGLAVPAVLGEAFCCLHNKKMEERERMASSCQGAMTGLFDDFFDKQYLSDDRIEKLLEVETATLKKSNEKLFNFFYKTALELVPDKKNMQEALAEVYDAQQKSKKQMQRGTSISEIERITFYKGGTSLLFYRSAFLPLPSAKEKELLYNLGSMMQLANDIFDVYKDRESGVRTLVTHTNNIDLIRQLFSQQLSLYFKHAYKGDFKKETTTKFLSVLSLGIFARAFVCLDQLKNNQKETNNIFSVDQYSRKQLICDMDTKRNMLRSAFYFIKLMKEENKNAG